MDMDEFIRSLEHKTILITGSTGFLAKVFMEKLLRVQPRVKKLFLLIRAEDDISATERFQKEVMKKELFRVLKKEVGTGFDEFISEKISVIVGDISLDNLGVKDSALMNELFREINFIINSAGTTSFDERYDVSLCINATGAKNIGEFARKCEKLELLVHVSTAFVTREKEGLILEKELQMGETYSGSSPHLDVDAEFQLVQQRLQELRQNEVNDKDIRISMKKLGLERATLHGWFNTYAFTKAIGEMLLELVRQHVPLVIVRPTIVTSTYKEPFPGWSEGFRNIDPFLSSYGKGKLTYFLGDPEGTMDAMPADMVVNAMIAIMANHQCHQSMKAVYHVSSSSPNPVKWSSVANWFYLYFLNHPLIDENGRPIKVSRFTLVPNLPSFNKLLTLQFKVPLMALRVANALSCNILKNQYCKLNQKFQRSVRLAELYFLLTKFKGRFEDSNLRKLREMMEKNDKKYAETFFFNPNCIDWDDYFMNVHIFGVTRYVMMLQDKPIP